MNETSRGPQKTMYLGDFLKEMGINKKQKKTNLAKVDGGLGVKREEVGSPN